MERPIREISAWRDRARPNFTDKVITLMKGRALARQLLKRVHQLSSLD